MNGNICSSGNYENIDLNAFGDEYPTGIYKVLATANDPFNSQGTWFWLIQINNQGDYMWRYQELICWYGTLEKYVRRKTSGAWENWKKVW